MTRRQKRSLYRIFLSAVLLLAAFIADKCAGEGHPLWLILIFYLPAYFTAGYDVLFRAARNIAHGQVFDENFLMALATVGALCIGFLPGGDPEFAEASFVMIFYQTGELFQSVAVGKSRRSIAALMNIKPETARLLRDGQETEVSPESVAVGETLVIRPGERVPLDGVVLSGESDLDTVALTGESAPLAVSPGEAVISGCTNLTGRLTVKVTKPYGESTVARVLSLMENASAKKSRSEQFITRFAHYYTPAVVFAALFIAFIPPIFTGTYLTVLPVWLSRALTFLVVSCPCALVISVPLSFFGGLGGASRMGVLVKGASDLEALAHTGVAVFDKTGTLTRGDFAVQRAVGRGVSERELLCLAAAAESDSNHPIARALRAAAGSEYPAPTSVKELAGRGVGAEVDGMIVAVGNSRLLWEQGIEAEEVAEPGTVVYVLRDGAYIGYVLIADTLKTGVAEALSELAAAGVSRRVMLTGDRENVASDVAAKLGISEYHAGLLPADKVTWVEAILEAPHEGTVAFVGDGINDAPVLSRADVGIAMGALGSDAAIEAADVVLMDDDPRKIACAVRHARRTLAIVRQNIVMALSVKGVVLLGAAFGIFGRLQMPLAIFADVGVAVLAILNAMRTLRVQK